MNGLLLADFWKNESVWIEFLIWINPDGFSSLNWAMEKTNFVFNANTPYVLVGGFTMLLIITAFAIASLFTGKLETIIAGLILFGITYFLLRSFVNKVQFGLDGIVVRYFIRKSLKIAINLESSSFIFNLIISE